MKFSFRRQNSIGQVEIRMNHCLVDSVAVPGLLIAPGLYITPAIRMESGSTNIQKTGNYVLTHRSGYAVTKHTGACMDCTREAAKIATSAGIDWDREDYVIRWDVDASYAAQKANAKSMACQYAHEQP
jgi:hypothetical protein